MKAGVDPHPCRRAIVRRARRSTFSGRACLIGAIRFFFVLVRFGARLQHRVSLSIGFPVAMRSHPEVYAPCPPSLSRICTWWCAVCCVLSPVRNAGLRCDGGSRTLSTALRAPGVTGLCPPVRGLCTPPRQLPALPRPININPAALPPSWSVGSEHRAHEARAPAHRPGHVTRQQVRRTASSAQTAVDASSRAGWFLRPRLPQQSPRSDAGAARLSGPARRSACRPRRSPWRRWCD
jgi:hypothetical protein